MRVDEGRKVVAHIYTSVVLLTIIYSSAHPPAKRGEKMGRLVFHSHNDAPKKLLGGYMVK